MNNPSGLRTRELVAMVSMIMALSAMAIDFMTPAFGDIRLHYGLGTGSTAAAQIITFFFFGEMAQVLYGPLSDRFGRLPVLRSGFVVYAVGSIASALAPTFGLMLGARLFWGLGAAALQVSAGAIVRDHFKGDEMARIMSLVFSIFLIVPVIAPLAGAALLSVASWQVVFGFPAVLAVAVFGWSLRLGESRPESNIVALEFRAIGRAFRYVASNRRTVRYTLAAALLFGAFVSFLSSFERVIGEIYGRPGLFPVTFAGMTAVAALVMLGNARLVGRIGARTAVVRILIAYGVAGVGYLAWALISAGVPALAVTIVLLGGLLALNTAASINFGSLALEPMGEQAGMAAAIYGSFYVGGGAAIGSIIDRQLADSLTPWAAALFASGVLAFLLIPGPRLGGAQRSVKVGDEVVDVLDPDAESN